MTETAEDLLRGVAEVGLVFQGNFHDCLTCGAGNYTGEPLSHDEECLHVRVKEWFDGS